MYSNVASNSFVAKDDLELLDISALASDVLKTFSTMGSFYCDSGDSVQDFMYARQALHQLSCVSSRFPNTCTKYIKAFLYVAR